MLFSIGLVLPLVRSLIIFKSYPNCTLKKVFKLSSLYKIFKFAEYHFNYLYISISQTSFQYVGWPDQQIIWSHPLRTIKQCNICAQWHRKVNIEIIQYINTDTMCLPLTSKYINIIHIWVFPNPCK